MNIHVFLDFSRMSVAKYSIVSWDDTKNERNLSRLIQEDEKKKKLIVYSQKVKNMIFLHKLR